MNLADYDYPLPQELIAQNPLENRDESRLMVLPGGEEPIVHSRFSSLPEFLRPGDLLVLNDTRVFPARLVGTKKGTGGEAEIFLLHPYGDGTWDALARPARRLREGSVIRFGNGVLTAEVREKREAGHVRIGLTVEQGGIDEALDRIGNVPLPPYIKRAPEESDRERYQTVYAEKRGAVAAPTAGLHFTADLLNRLTKQGIGNVRVTLHVGIGTFRPLSEKDAGQDRLHSEYCEIPEETMRRIGECRAGSGRVVAVGTTTTRALETAVQADGDIGFTGWSELFIKPPYRFRAVDVLITNFHLPRSSLLLMVSAFGGKERILAAYREAVRERYRFYSYGDAMLIFGETT